MSKDCVFYIPYEFNGKIHLDQGRCHRFPPNTRGDYSKVFPDCFCGEEKIKQYSLSDQQNTDASRVANL